MTLSCIIVIHATSGEMMFFEHESYIYPNYQELLRENFFFWIEYKILTDIIVYFQDDD